MSSLDQKHLYAVEGYLRSFVDNFDKVFPSQLTLTVVNLMGYLFVCFDLTTTQKENASSEFVDSTKTIFDASQSYDYSVFDSCHRFPFVNAGCSVGARKGVNTYKVKCIDDYSDFYMSQDVAIGIVPDITQNLMNRNTSNMEHFYMWFHGEGIICKENKLRTKEMSISTTWKSEDIITVKIDCNEWRVFFYLNGKLFHTWIGLKIKEGHTYHLCIHSKSRGKFQLLQYIWES